MIKIEKLKIYGWDDAIRGMRNPMNSWSKTDSGHCLYFDFDCNDCYLKNNQKSCGYMNQYVIGENDLSLMKRLTKAGTDHRKFLRMINVYMDINAPLYWWKEYDTYKVGTVANSCSTMHKIQEKEFELDDFSHEHLLTDEICAGYSSVSILENVVKVLNENREKFIETKDKDYWWQMIQLLPSSFNQKRTVLLNYEVLINMYKSRNKHKLDEWRQFCKQIEELPYFKEIVLGKDES